MRLRHFERDEFIAERFHYSDGEHVAGFGPSGTGKTTLAYQLLKRVATPERRLHALIMKPRDETVEEWSKHLGLKTTRDWPPPPWMLRGNHVGWNVWPDHKGHDPDEMDDIMARIFRRSMIDAYNTKQPRVIFADEVAGLADLYIEPERGKKRKSLEAVLKAIWMRGRSMNCGQWGWSQRPFEVPQLAFASHHLFLANDPDLRSRQRYDEVGGVEKNLIRDITKDLPEFHWLYRRRAGGRMCTIGP